MGLWAFKVKKELFSIDASRCANPQMIQNEHWLCFIFSLWVRARTGSYWNVIKTLKIRDRKVFEKSIIPFFGQKAKSATSIALVTYVCQIYSLRPAVWETTYFSYSSCSCYDRKHFLIFTCFSSAVWDLSHRRHGGKKSPSSLQQHSIYTKLSSTLKKNTFVFWWIKKKSC